MHWLELRVPPLALTIALVVVTVAADRLWPATSYSDAAYVWPALLVVVAGAVVCLAGVLSFRQAGTTVDPTRPARASALIERGIYAWTRNPMYLGFAFVILGVALLLSNWLGVLLAMAFVPYMNRWQIGPEERALGRAFGDSFTDYARRVRRWL